MEAPKTFREAVTVTVRKADRADAASNNWEGLEAVNFE